VFTVKDLNNSKYAQLRT